MIELAAVISEVTLSPTGPNPEQDADEWERCARIQGVFVHRKGNTVTINGTLDMGLSDQTSEARHE